MGGNVFKGQTDRIKKDNIEITLTHYFNELEKLFPKKKHIFDNFIPVGSVGKKETSGDIDLALEINLLTSDDYESWGLNSNNVYKRFNILKNRAKTSTDSQILMKAFLQELSSYINENSDIIHCEEKKTTHGNLFCMFPQYSHNGILDKYVQIDWMIGNIDWLLFAYYCDDYTGNIKGLHRTQLMIAMFVNKGYTFSHTSGIKCKNTNKEYHTPSDAINLLNSEYNIDLSAVLYNYTDLHNVIKNTKDYDSIMSIYFRILDSTRCDIPLDLHDLWKKKHKSLKLSGKFLPDDSLLKEFICQE